MSFKTNNIHIMITSEDKGEWRGRSVGGVVYKGENLKRKEDFKFEDETVSERETE